MKKILLDVAIVAVFVVTVWFVYQQYGEQIITTLFGEKMTTMYVESTPIKVTVADEPDEYQLGLSGTESLDEYAGKLFVFSKEDYYGIWMKDMNYSLDIFWINNDMKIVHFEENVSPDTFPDSFVSTEPARFVLETNAFFASDNNIVVGDVVQVPASALPRDLIKELQ